MCRWMTVEAFEVFPISMASTRGRSCEILSWFCTSQSSEFVLLCSLGQMRPPPVPGTPPLPPFEMVTFNRDQPAHFLPARDNKVLRKLAEADAGEAWRLFHYRLPADDKTPTGENPDARSFAVGSVAAGRRLDAASTGSGTTAAIAAGAGSGSASATTST